MRPAGRGRCAACSWRAGAFRGRTWPSSDPTARIAGETTSGTFSPTLKAGVALALVDPALTFGDEVAIDIRGRAVPARIVRLPFVESSPK